MALKLFNEYMSVIKRLTKPQISKLSLICYFTNKKYYETDIIITNCF